MTDGKYKIRYTAEKGEFTEADSEGGKYGLTDKLVFGSIVTNDDGSSSTVVHIPNDITVAEQIACAIQLLEDIEPIDFSIVVELIKDRFRAAKAGS